MTASVQTSASAGEQVLVLQRHLANALEALRNVPLVGDVYDQQHADTHMRAALELEALAKSLGADVVQGAAPIEATCPEHADAPVFAYVQEGGATGELYLHTFESLADAHAGAVSCADSSYRTSPIVEIPRRLADVEGFEDVVTELLMGLEEMDYADPEMVGAEDLSVRERQ